MAWERFINQNQIDDVQTDVDALAVVADNIYEETEVIDLHIHNREKWFGLAAAPSGETHIADRVGGATQPFRLTSGNNTFGNWVQILGSSDTPVISGDLYIDAHRCMVTATNSTLPFIIQIAVGESSGLAAKIAAEQFTEFMYISSSNNNDSGISDVMSIRVPVGTKIWARCACIGGNGTTIDFYYGIHGYNI